MAHSQLLLSIRAPLSKLEILGIGADLENIFNICIAPFDSFTAWLHSVVAEFLGLSQMGSSEVGTDTFYKNQVCTVSFV